MKQRNIWESAMLALLISCCLIHPSKLKAQDSTNYFSVSFVKLKDPSFSQEYEELLKFYSKKIMEYRTKQGNVIDWSVWKIVMPVGSSSAYDYAVVVTSKDWQVLMDDTLGLSSFKEAIPDLGDNLRRSLINHLNELRTIVKREVYASSAGTHMSKSLPVYVEVDYMKPASGKYEEYVKAEKETWMPVHKERIKMGVLADWELDEKVLPSEANAEYDIITVNAFNNVQQMTDPKYPEAFKTVWPQMDINKVGATIGTQRTLVRSDLMKLVIYVDATTSGRTVKE
jgi:hypothetical protein